MRKIIYYVAASLDNYIAHADDTVTGFLPFYEGPHIPDFMADIHKFDAILMGRKTYEFGFQYGLKMGEPAYPFHPMKNYVFSRTMQFENSDQVTLVQSDEVEFVRQLKDTDGGLIWLCGGSQFAATLLDNELIDEVIVKLYPVLLGDGKRMFGDSTKSVYLDQYRAQIYPNGVAFLSYRVKYPS
ncbi:MAG: dihydrofolate reductase family protein [Anaerolineae bacterium]|nr:dihydrofolate reductase family protein [Anaerolineae bacterium]